MLTDMVMPRMSGPELAKRLTALQPAIRILYVSGHVDDPTVLEAMGKGSRDFLQKPFSGSVPARKIMEVLNRPKVWTGTVRLARRDLQPGADSARGRKAGPGGGSQEFLNSMELYLC